MFGTIEFEPEFEGEKNHELEGFGVVVDCSDVGTSLARTSVQSDLESKGATKSTSKRAFCFMVRDMEQMEEELLFCKHPKIRTDFGMDPKIIEIEKNE